MYIYIVYIVYIVHASQYFTPGDIETIREYIETHSDKSISGNSLCNLTSIILKNNYFENEELNYHQKRDFATENKFATPCSNSFMAGLEKRIFQNSEFKCGYDTLMRFFVYEPKVLKT